MGQQTHRRAFLATVGLAVTGSLAGCSALPGGDGDDTPATPTDSPTDSDGTPTPTENGSDKPQGPGTSVDQLDDPRKWEIVAGGELKSTGEDPFREGKQYFQLKSSDDQQQPLVKISRTLPINKEIDLSGHDLSIAAKIKEPAEQIVKVRAIVHTQTGGSVTASRQILPTMDGWVRFDLGYTGQSGSPDLSSVPRIDLQIGPTVDNKQFVVLLDDLRMLPKASKGKVMLQFDDSNRTIHENALPIMQDAGFKGAVAHIPGVSGSTVLNRQMIKELANDGWDIVTHDKLTLTELKSEDQQRELQRAQQAIEALGFPDGSKHYVVPRHKVDASSLKFIDEFFTAGYLRGGCPNNAKKPSNPAFISRINGADVRGSMDLIDMAAAHNQLVVLYFHRVGGGNGSDTYLPTADFRSLIDHINQADVDVVTPTQWTSSW